METYYVGDCEGLEKMRENPESEFILTDDINMNNKNWKPVSRFGGILDGNGHSIKNLRIEISEGEDNECGFIRCFSSRSDEIDSVVRDISFQNALVKVENGLDCGVVMGRNSDAKISNCNVKNSEIKGNAHRMGGIVGRNKKRDCLIQNCVSENLVVINIDESIPSRVGGIVGENWSDTINSKVSKSVIKGAFMTGGLLGSMFVGTNIYNCSSHCIVKSSKVAGGLVGVMEGSGRGHGPNKIEDTYFVGEVEASASGVMVGELRGKSIIENSHWVSEESARIGNFLEASHYENSVINNSREVESQEKAKKAVISGKI